MKEECRFYINSILFLGLRFLVRKKGRIVNSRVSRV